LILFSIGYFHLFKNYFCSKPKVLEEGLATGQTDI